MIERWSPGQIVAWIAWRDEEVVRAVGDDTPNDVRMKRTFARNFLRRIEDDSFEDAWLDDGTDAIGPAFSPYLAEPRMEPSDALKEFQRALADRSLSASLGRSATPDIVRTRWPAAQPEPRRRRHSAARAAIDAAIRERWGAGGRPADIQVETAAREVHDYLRKRRSQRGNVVPSIDTIRKRINALDRATRR